MGESISSEHRCFLPQQQHSHTVSVNYTLEINCKFLIPLIMNHVHSDAFSVTLCKSTHSMYRSPIWK